MFAFLPQNGLDQDWSLTSAEIPGVEMVGHDRAPVRRDTFAMSDAGQGEMKTQPHKKNLANA